MSITTVLVANRGEIACRIIRTVRGLGLRAIAVYSEADAGAPHVALADDAVLIGPGPVGDSYLDANKILAAAKESGADAVHPGYGFLSENTDFAAQIIDAGIIFIGPDAHAIQAMGNKAEAKRLMIAANVPCIPGYEDEDQSDAAFIAAASDIGFPIMVKAAAGGGGRGMRLVESADDLRNALELARSEALNAFGSGELILEKAIMQPRHVEVQVFADSHGNCIHLGERDCSVQRRHQKVVEEAPCPVMTPELRQRMGDAAVAVARSVDYRGAGTVEFLLDADGEFYFLEMNTRLQVEHPVTELITGLDLVAMQIAVANGDKLPVSQEEINLKGHAIEVRLYAEDPAKDFLPVTGHIDLWQAASGDGIRVDDGIVTGQEISPYYDPMLAKVIAWGENRDIARARLVRALKESVLLGPVSNTVFLVDILERERFASGEATTAFIGEEYPDGVTAPAADATDLAIVATAILQEQQQASFAKARYLSANQLNWSSATLMPTPLDLVCGEDDHHVTGLATRNGWQIMIGEDSLSVTILDQTENSWRLQVNDHRHQVTLARGKDGILHLARDAKRLSFRAKKAGRDDSEVASGTVTAPMPGAVIDIKAEEGATVAKGDVLVVLEAMKMQHQIAAKVDGVVKTIGCSTGSQVASGDLLVEIEEQE